ncbi:MAG: tRNA (N6-threonylcarbamoyladenosine(37)-N6)-methyltransferase TrmO [Bacteroidales bacterium]|nr:tRNA (N6-threonylcarbamoyladenosine(37)-N6)-methyltransferase TrmO [Bacteroidales bacterium]
MDFVPIAHIVTPFDEKFGVPRQAGLADHESRVVFEPRFRVNEALRGIEEFDYLWLIWLFDRVEAAADGWRPTVRPPRLGGNRRLGVFATRSPFRPNPIGLSCVKLLEVRRTEGEGTVLVVAGADMVNGTPILDIKPYVAYADAHAEARCGYAQCAPLPTLNVCDPGGCLDAMPDALRGALRQALALDPRPHYQSSPSRRYIIPFGGYEVSFCVDGCDLTVLGCQLEACNHLPSGSGASR